MRLQEYQKLAARTINLDLSKMDMERHAVFGMGSEVGELLGLYQKTFQGHSIDYDHAMLELGDVLWFLAEYCTVRGWSLEDVAAANIEKLKARYPDGFDAGHSLHRREGDI